MNAPIIAAALLAVTFLTVEAGPNSCAGALQPPSCYESSYGPPLPSPYNSAPAPCYTTRPRPCFPSSAQLPAPRPSVPCSPMPPSPCQTPYAPWPVVTYQDRACSAPFPSPCPAPCAPPPPSCPAPCSPPPISYASPSSPQSSYSPQSFGTASFNPALLTILKYLKSPVPCNAPPPSPCFPAPCAPPSPSVSFASLSSPQYSYSPQSFETASLNPAMLTALKYFKSPAPCNPAPPSSPCKIPTPPPKMIPVQLSPLPLNRCSKAPPTCAPVPLPPSPCQSRPYESSPSAFGDPSLFSSLNYVTPSSSFPCGFK